MDADKYCDVILFVSGLSSQNDFSFHYINDYVLFENLSYDGIKFFLNRFKNFDICPTNVSGFDNNTFNFNFKVDLIYQNNYNKIKVELPISKCSDCILNTLNGLQNLIDIFHGLNFSIEQNQTTLILSNLNQSNLPTIVSKMRSIQLKPKSIGFSSKSLFQLIFNLEDILKSNIGDLKQEPKLFKKSLNKKKIERKNGSLNESALSTDEFPTSLESINEYKIRPKKSLKKNIVKSLKNDSKNNLKVKPIHRKRKKFLYTIRRQRGQSKPFNVKQQISDISNESFHGVEMEADEENNIPLVKWGKTIEGPTKRSERLIEKKGIVKWKPVDTVRLRKSRKALNATAPTVLVTDICSLRGDLNLTSTPIDSNQVQNKRSTIDSAIDSVVNRYCGIRESATSSCQSNAFPIATACLFEPIAIKLESTVNPFFNNQNFNIPIQFTGLSMHSSQQTFSTPSYNSIPIDIGLNQNQLP